MKQIAFILAFLVFVLPSGRGQSWLPNAASAQSRSGQFVVYGVEAGAVRPFAPQATTNTPLTRLEPALLVVSCERIKHALLSALGAKDEWTGKIFVALHPFHDADEEIIVTFTRFSDKWNYRVDLPDAIEPARLVRAITQVLLLEMSNREAVNQPAQLPPWLAEGMPSYLIAKSDVELVLQPATSTTGTLPVRSSVREGRYSDPFVQARKQLHDHAPLTIEELSRLPAAEEMEGEMGEIYRNSAMLFIHELLKLKNGGACLFALLPELPWDPDWRVGFLKAFKQHFKRVVDLEKWWALQSAYLAGRDSGRNWRRAESLAKLDEALRTPFEIRLGSNDPPFYTDVSLQAIIKGWKMERQLPVLREKIILLQNLHLRVAPELRPLVRQYCDVLNTYLNKMEGGAAKQKPFVMGRHPIVTARSNETSAPSEDNPILKQTIAQLDILDERCSAWKAVRDKLSESTR
jgi:hypothetical protein